MASIPIQVGEESLLSTAAGQARERRAPTRRFYHPELDVLRFFAFLSVFVHHSMYNFFPTVSRGGAYGLSFFFVLSAFLITELLQREKRATGTVAIVDFYIRRGLRIWPLYFGFLACTVVLYWIVPRYQAPAGMLLCFALLIGNTYIGRNGFPNNPASYLWSISVEEQFYLFWPLLNKKCSRRTLGWIAITTLPVGSCTVLVLSGMGASANLGIWTNSFVEFQFFGYGVLLSLILNGRIPDISLIGRLLLFVTGMALWFAASMWSGVNAFERQRAFGPMVGYHCVGLGCICIFLSLYGVQEHWMPRPLVYLGKISYGLYVFHEISLETAESFLRHLQDLTGDLNHVLYGLAHVAIGFAITIGLAWISYRYFESPFLRLKEQFTVIRSRVL